MIPVPRAGLDTGSGAATNSPRSFFFFSSGAVALFGGSDGVVGDEICPAGEVLPGGTAPGDESLPEGVVCPHAEDEDAEHSKRIAPIAAALVSLAA